MCQKCQLSKLATPIGQSERQHQENSTNFNAPNGPGNGALKFEISTHRRISTHRARRPLRVGGRPKRPRPPRRAGGGCGETPRGSVVRPPVLRPCVLFPGYSVATERLLHVCHRASADGPSPPRGKRQSPRTPRTIRAMRKGSCQASGPTPGAGGLRARQFEAEGEATPQDVAGDAAALDPPRA